MPGGQDHWWWLRSGSRPGPLAAEVIGALTDYGLPSPRGPAGMMRASLAPGAHRLWRLTAEHSAAIEDVLPERDV